MTNIRNKLNNKFFIDIYLSIIYLQNLINLPGSNNVYQVTNNQRDMSNRQPTITSYEVRFACPSCSQIFVSENLLQMHMKCNHNFICDTCNLRFYNFDDYNLHKAKHNLI